MYTNILTDRLEIRLIKLDDADFILRLVNSEGWLQFIGDRNVTNPQEAKKYIQKILDTPTYYYNIIELKTSKQPVGVVTLIEREKQIYPDIGFALLPKFEGKGYALEASTAYLRKIIESKLFEKILGITKSNNQKSIRLLEKLGLTYEYDYMEDENTILVYSIGIN